VEGQVGTHEAERENQDPSSIEKKELIHPFIRNLEIMAKMRYDTIDRIP
jgi:hypothetical protein